jgi:glutamate synthase (NADPH/NADH)
MLDFSAILENAAALRPGTNIIGGSVRQDFDLDKRLDYTIIQAAKGIISGEDVDSNLDLEFPIANDQRTFGATLSFMIARRFGEAGLPGGASRINIRLTGSAGQSFCAFLAAGVTVTLIGDANDYVGKCLSGGRIVVYPPPTIGGANGDDEFCSEKNVIVGNVCLYGATSGTAYFRGMGAERFCVRNSGATAVIEGVGDHGCEYMTGGRVIILGRTGRNFAAGMSGGIAYVLDEAKTFSRRCNSSMVDLLPVESDSDLTFLEATLRDFSAATGSQVAAGLLADWPAAAVGFVKVFPHEYQRALQELAEEEKAAAAANKHGDSTMNGLTVQMAQLGDDLDKLKSPNLDIRNAYAIDNTPAVFSQTHLILPAEKMEPDSSDEDDDETAVVNGGSGPRLALPPPPQIKLPPIKVLDMKKKNSTTTKPVLDIEDAIADAVMKKKKREVLLDKTRGFVKYKREARSYRPATERIADWDEIYDFKHVRRGLKTQAARCMDCGVPFCHSVSHGCPLGNIIPKFNDLVFHSDWKEALNQLTQTNNFPEFTGRVCPAPCEGACVLGINEPAVTIKNIECAIIDNAFEEGWIRPEPPKRRTGKTVAIVGSGPAGLAAADQLNKAGHTVTVYERNNRIGGLLMYGIPTMKLSKQVVQRRIDLLAAEGVTFKTGVAVGTDVSAAELRRTHDALLLCTGATWPRDLPIENRSLEGIHFAMEFLQTWQRKQHGDDDIDHLPLSAAGLDVIVIGGGDTGCDCIGTSLRQGAKSITSFEILPTPPPARAADNPWPQYPRLFKVDYGHEEVAVKWGSGDPRRYNTLSKRFVGDSGTGRVAGVETVEVEWTKDEAGRWTMKARVCVFSWIWSFFCRNNFNCFLLEEL